MSEVELRLTKVDIEKAMSKYLKEKYPNLELKSMRIEYNRNRQVGNVSGYLR